MDRTRMDRTGVRSADTAGLRQIHLGSHIDHARRVRKLEVRRDDLPEIDRERLATAARPTGVDENHGQEQHDA